MNKNTLGVFILGFVLTGSAFADVSPHLFLKYGQFFDSQCSKLSGYIVKAESIQEVTAKMPSFQAAWDSEAPVLLSTLYSEIGKNFSRKEMTVTASICNVISMNDPFLVNVRRWIPSVMSPNPIGPMNGFVDVTFHEFLHNYLEENLKTPTPLLEEYKTEDARVRGHLHLMALQKDIYTKLGRQDMLNWLDSFYTQIGDPYTRAWKIVNQIENYRSFVNEVRR